MTTPGPAAPPRSRRERVLVAAMEIAVRTGIGSVSARGLAAAAGTSEQELLATFGGTDQRVVAALAWRGTPLAGRARAAFSRASGRWELRLDAALRSAARDLVADPLFARFCLLEVPAGGPRAQEVLREGIAYCRRWLRIEEGSPAGVAPLEDVIVVATAHSMATAVRAGRMDQLPELVPAVVHAAALVRYGPARAARYLEDCGRQGGGR